MLDRKRLVTFAIAFVAFSTIYAFVTWRVGTPPGLFVPSAFFLVSWFIGQVVAESLFLKDEARWKRMAATVGAFAATFIGLGFLVIMGARMTPVDFAERTVVDLVFGYAAVALGLRLPRFRRFSK
jgi:hypothetical protein